VNILLQKILAFRYKLSWSLGGNIIYALSQWAIVTILARFGSLEELGLYSLGLAITAPIVLFFNFQLKVVFATDSLNEYNFSQYLGARISHLTIAFLIIIIVAFLYTNNLYTITIIILIGLVKYFEALSDICMGLYQKKDRIDLIGKSQFFKGIYSIIFVGTIYILTSNLIISVFGLLIVMVLRFFLNDIKYLKRYGNIKPVFDTSAINLAKISYPLGITALIVSLNTNIPRYLLDHFSGIEEVGVFSALYYIIIAGNMLITPISQLAAPRISKSFRNENSSKFVKINTHLSILVMIVFVFILIPVIFKGDIILSIIYGSKYSIYSNTFLIISISLFFGFIGAIQNVSIIAARELKYQSIIGIIVTSITFITSYYLIKLYGVQGAAYSLLISRFIHTSLYLILLSYIVHKRWPKFNKQTDI
jgi:O-antigen/teichoic acid export membrane protein